MSTFRELVEGSLTEQDEYKLPPSFYEGRGFEAKAHKEKGNMKMYHAAMSDQHIKFAKKLAKTNPAKSKWHGEQSSAHIAEMKKLS